MMRLRGALLNAGDVTRRPLDQILMNAGRVHDNHAHLLSPVDNRILGNSPDWGGM